MEAFQASLHADYVRAALLQAHAYRGCGVSKVWERSALETALVHFDKLVALEPVIRARFAALQAPQSDQTEEAA